MLTWRSLFGFPVAFRIKSVDLAFFRPSLYLSVLIRQSLESGYQSLIVLRFFAAFRYLILLIFRSLAALKWVALACASLSVDRLPSKEWEMPVPGDGGPSIREMWATGQIGNSVHSTLKVSPVFTVHSLNHKTLFLFSLVQTSVNFTVFIWNQQQCTPYGLHPIHLKA